MLTPETTPGGLPVFGNQPPCATTDDEAVIAGLRGLLASIGPGTNRHDQATTLIHACIDTGITTGPEIVRTLAQLGFDRRHAGTTLRHGTGPNPSLYRWMRDKDGTYHNHD